MDVRETLLHAGDRVVALVEDRAVADAWERPSALPYLTVGALTAHLVRALATVVTYLHADEPGEDAPVRDAAGYLHVALSDDDLDGALHRGIRERADDSAADGPQVVGEQARAALDELHRRLPGLAIDRRVAVKDGIVLTLGQYLETRLVELVVHTDDLVASTGVGCELPAAATDTAIAVLVALARRRHGDAALLHALARRERAPVAGIAAL